MSDSRRTLPDEASGSRAVEPGGENCTLYEDWKARRRELAESAARADDLRSTQIELLDYLLNRYRDSPEAARPVCYPRRGNTYVNDRALIVLRHLGREWCPSITSPREAAERVRSIIDRKSFIGRRSLPPWWDDSTAQVQSIAGSSSQLDRAGEMLRLRLAHANPSVRWAAAVELALVGRLEDIGLLSDLLTLTSSVNERPALVYAMQRLAEVECEPPQFTESAPVEEAEADPGPSLPDWTCLQCGTTVSWYSEKCHQCGAPYAVAGDTPP